MTNLIAWWRGGICRWRGHDPQAITGTALIICRRCESVLRWHDPTFVLDQWRALMAPNRPVKNLTHRQL